MGIHCTCDSGCEASELIYKEVLCLCNYDKECKKCNGTGFYNLEKCMNYYLDKNAFIFYSAYIQYNNGILPWAGGYMQQTNSFIIHATYFDRVINKYEKIKNDRRRKNGR